MTDFYPVQDVSSGCKQSALDTALSMQAERGCFDECCDLIHGGAHVNTYDEAGSRPLHHALHGGCFDLSDVAKSRLLRLLAMT